MAQPKAFRATYGDLFGTTQLPVLEELFRSEFNQHPGIRDIVAKTVTTDRDIYQYSELHDMPMFSAVAEGADYTFSYPKQGYDKTLTVSKYGLGFSCTEEMVDDGKFEHIADAVKKMGKSAKESREQSVCDLFNNGFSSVTTADGNALFYATHTTPTGTYTVRNVLSTAADLSVTSLKLAISDFEKVFLGDTGIKNRIMPKYLLVPSELRMYAKELVGSSQLADTANNNMNSIGDEGLTVISSPHLTDADAWFLLSGKDEHGLRVISRKPVETKMADPAVGWMNDSIFIKARYRETVDALHPHGVFGTAGYGS